MDWVVRQMDLCSHKFVVNWAVRQMGLCSHNYVMELVC